VRKSFLLMVIVLAALLLIIGCGKKAEQNANVATADSLTQTTQPSVPEVKQPEPQQVAQEPVKKAEEKPATPPPAPKPKPVVLTLAESTMVEIVLADSVQTNENKVGDQFAGTVAKAVEIDGRVAIPEGAKALLEITKLVEGGRLKTSPEMEFTLKEVVAVDGQSHPVQTSTFYEKGRSHTDREVGMIGGGAAAGAVIGAIAGDKKGAAIGAAVGAAAGTGAAAATGKQNLKYLPGKSVTFTLQQSMKVTLPAK
jgi:hypothetical protein